MKMSLTRTLFTSFIKRHLYFSNRLSQLYHYQLHGAYRVQLSSKFRTLFTRPQHLQISTSLNKCEPENWKSSALPMRYVFVTTSNTIYEDVPDGFMFDTAYVDSHADSSYNPKLPVILAVHNLRSSHEELVPFLAPLVLKNYRVIAVNLPSSMHTKGVGLGHDDGFIHTTTENAEFIKDFLKVLKIPKVDVLLGHGTGCYPVVCLCATSDLFKAAALICPGGHLLCPGAQPQAFYTLFSEVWDVPYFRPLAKVYTLLWKIWHRSKKDMDEVIRSFILIWGIDFNSIGGYLFNMNTRKVPVGVVYAKDDTFTDTNMLEHYCQLLGFQDNNFVHYDASGQVIKQGDTTGELLHHGLILEKGNPFEVLKNPLLNLIEKLVNKSRNP
ncbi:uncharacterized protein LOC115214079 [Argonauta hians]